MASVFGGSFVLGEGAVSSLVGGGFSFGFFNGSWSRCV